MMKVEKAKKTPPTIPLPIAATVVRTRSGVDMAAALSSVPDTGLGGVGGKGSESSGLIIVLDTAGVTGLAQSMSSGALACACCELGRRTSLFPPLSSRKGC